MSPERGVDQYPEFRPVLGEKPGPFVEAYACGAIAPVVRRVAACLIGGEIDMDPSVGGELQKVDDIAMIGHGYRPLFRRGALRESEGISDRIDDTGNPALGQSGFYAGTVHLGDDRGRPGDLGGLSLRPRHAPQARGDEEFSGQILSWEFPANPARHMVLSTCRILGSY